MLEETAELAAELRDPRFTQRLALQLETMLTILENRGLSYFGGAGVAMWWLAEQVREDRFRYLLERNELQLASTRTICRSMGTVLPRPPRWGYMSVIAYVWKLWDTKLPPGESRQLRPLSPLPPLHPSIQAVLDALIKEILQ